ncbi:proteasome accessory factor C [Actinomyces denticolens]|uniref:Proteasome accessory factor C n=1 Tax=Actinomyces denticolens TaxID=52767 RepID=A0ABY1I846_9ACTO|nr:WYL domain-containing protein [Actinomyces denticolens]SHI64786.1 proteasome accessory factor C [Actinomyces denticolens]
MARTPAAARLVRLLALPAWVAENDGATIAEAAAHFEVDEDTIRRDVGTLWVSGLPGGLHDDLVDFSATAWEAGRLSLSQAHGLDRPVRLSHEEAVSLLLSLRVLRGVLGADAGAATALGGAESTLASLLGPAAPPPDDDPLGAPGAPNGPGSPGEPGPVGPASEADPTTILAQVRRALDEGRRLHLSYVSATDVPSERDVDPIALRSDGSMLTLTAWCLTARAERSFRLDRILSASVLDTSGTAHRRRRSPQGRSAGHDQDEIEAPTAELILEPTGRWLIEQLPRTRAEILDDGAIRAVVEGRDWDWLRGLVLSTGRHLRSVAPAHLARSSREAALAALDAYADGGNPSA